MQVFRCSSADLDVMRVRARVCVHACVYACVHACIKRRKQLNWHGSEARANKVLDA
jgi:hypothetical protein